MQIMLVKKYVCENKLLVMNDTGLQSSGWPLKAGPTHLIPVNALKVPEAPSVTFEKYVFSR